MPVKFKFFRLPNTRGSQNKSDSSSSRDEASNAQAEAAIAETSATTSNCEPDATTGNEFQTKKETRSDPHGMEFENTTTRIDQGVTNIGKEKVPLTTEAESPELMLVNEHLTSQPKVDPERGTTANNTELGERRLSNPVAKTSPDLSDLLWDEAYDEVKQEHPEMVTWYEQTLSARLERSEEDVASPTSSDPVGPFESHINQTDRGIRRSQMKELLESWLCEVEDEDESEYEGSDKSVDDIEEQADIITARKILSAAVQSTSPIALLAWVGICFASRIFLNLKYSNKEDCQDLVYVISRMDWYGRLPKLLSEENSVDSVDSVEYQLKKRVICLYKAILSYEMNLLCSHGGTLAFSFPNNIFKPRGPSSTSVKAIKDAEAALPLFNEESVYRPLLKRMSSAEEMLKSTTAGAYTFKSESESSSDDSEGISVMLSDLHIDDKQPVLLDTEYNQEIGDLYEVLRKKQDYKDFCNWEKGDSQILWIRGSPGQGKTMLTKSVVQGISISRGDSVSQCHSFFFDYRSSKVNNAAAALRNLIWNIINYITKAILRA